MKEVNFKSFKYSFVSSFQMRKNVMFVYIYIYICMYTFLQYKSKFYF